MRELLDLLLDIIGTNIHFKITENFIMDNLICCLARQYETGKDKLKVREKKKEEIKKEIIFRISRQVEPGSRWASTFAPRSSRTRNTVLVGSWNLIRYTVNVWSPLILSNLLSLRRSCVRHAWRKKLIKLNYFSYNQIRRILSRIFLARDLLRLIPQQTHRVENTKCCKNVICMLLSQQPCVVLTNA